MSPVLKLEVEWVSGSGSFADESAYLQKPNGVTIKRGRAAFERQTSAGTMTLTLKNDTGRFTPEFAASPVHPNVRRGKRVRLSAFVNGQWNVRFTGYAQQWAVGSIRKGVGARCTLTCVDGLGFFGAPLGPTAREVLESYGCVAYWPCTETEGTLFSDVMGRGFPALSLQHIGTLGTATLGDADGLPIDDQAKVLTLTGNANGTQGYGVKAGGTLAMPAEFTVGLWVSGQGSIPANLPNGAPILTIESGPLSLTFAREAANTYRCNETTAGNGSGYYVIGIGEPTLILMSVGTTSLNWYASGSGTVFGAVSRRVAGAPYSGATFQIGAGKSWAMDAIKLGHAFILPTALTRAEMETLAGYLLDTGSTNADDRIERWYGWFGEPQALVTLGTAPATVGQVTDGQVPSQLAQTYAEGLAARHLFNRDGAPLWIGWDYRPAQVTIPPGWIDADDFTFATTPEDYIDRVDATLPGGGTYTYAKTNPEIRNPASITGVAADDALTASVAQWIAESADGGARVPQFTIHLDRLTPANQAAMADLDIASRMLLSSLPETLPSSLPVVGEGYSETFTDTWDQTWNVSADPDLFIWDESLYDDTPVWGI